MHALFLSCVVVAMIPLRSRGQWGSRQLTAAKAEIDGRCRGGYGSAPLPQLHQIADLGHEHVLLLATLRCRAMSTRSINSVTRQRFVVRCFWLDNFARNQYKITRIN